MLALPYKARKVLLALASEDVKILDKLSGSVRKNRSEYIRDLIDQHFRAKGFHLVDGHWHQTDAETGKWAPVVEK